MPGEENPAPPPERTINHYRSQPANVGPIGAKSGDMPNCPRKTTTFTGPLPQALAASMSVAILALGAAIVRSVRATALRPRGQGGPPHHCKRAQRPSIYLDATLS